MRSNDEKLCTDLILDGVIMEDNLKYAGKEIKWLTNEIRKAWLFIT